MSKPMIGAQRRKIQPGGFSTTYRRPADIRSYEFRQTLLRAADKIINRQRLGAEVVVKS